jgi:hypothetical protein
VGQHLTPLMPNPPHITAGEVVAHTAKKGETQRLRELDKRAGALKSPGPSPCPYSPKCLVVEEEFSDVPQDLFKTSARMTSRTSEGGVSCHYTYCEKRVSAHFTQRARRKEARIWFALSRTGTYLFPSYS